jgi:hypothetical protein
VTGPGTQFVTMTADCTTVLVITGHWHGHACGSLQSVTADGNQVLAMNIIIMMPSKCLMFMAVTADSLLKQLYNAMVIK